MNHGTTPIFLLGCGRSGTNMLTKAISQSADVKLYNENHPDAFEKWRIKSLKAIERLNSQGNTLINLYKPILDTHMARDYLSFFPSSKIIFIFRYYGDVINSSIKRFGPKNWSNRVRRWMEYDFSEFSSAPPPGRTTAVIRSNWNQKLSEQSNIALYWLFYNQLYFDLGLCENSRVILVGYENIVVSPEKELQRICAFLNLEYSHKMIEDIFQSSVHRSSSPVIDPGVKIVCDNLLETLSREVDSVRQSR